MRCPRLQHFVRLQPNGKLGKCGHMVNQNEFDSIEQMQNSPWLKKIIDQFENGKWPPECVRCENTEQINKRSIRLDMIERDKILTKIKKDYLIIGGVIDNVCNSACQTCNASLSSKIGSLTKNSFQIDNYKKYNTLPHDRIVEIDISGGEPTYSPSYKKIIQDPPSNCKIIRINTNGHKTFDQIIPLLEKGIRVIVTVSFDGLEKIHDYVRWPVKFDQIQNTLIKYQKVLKQFPNLFRLNLWTTVSVYNINQLDQIIKYANDKALDHAWGLLETPSVLSIKKSNTLTKLAKKQFLMSKNLMLQKLSDKIATDEDNSKSLASFIKSQDQIRSIKFENYFNLCPQDL